MAPLEKDGVSKPRHGTKLRSRGCSLFSCFGSSSESGHAKPKDSRWGSSWLRGTKRTVLIESTVAAAAATCGGGNARKKCFFGRPREDKNVAVHHPQRQQQQLLPQEHPKDPVHHVASRCTTGSSEPAPLYRMLDPVQARTRTTTSHRSSPERGGGGGRRRRTNRSDEKLGIHGEFDASAGLSVLAVALAATLLCGRLCAVFCMAAWFYVLPRFRLPEPAAGSSTARSEKENEAAIVVDVDSEEYKKTVVLKGLLERDRRRPSATNLLPSDA